MTHASGARGRVAAVGVFPLLLLLASCGGGGDSPVPAPATEVPPPAGAAPASTRFALSVQPLSGVTVSAVLPDGTLRVLRRHPTVAGGTRFGDMTLDALGRFLYLEAGLPSDAPGELPLKAVTLQPETGAFLRSASVMAGIRARDLRFVPDGAFAYALGGSAGLRVFRIGPDGTLTELAGSPFGPVADGDLSGFSVLVHPSGRLLYLRRPGSGGIRAYRLDPATGLPTPLPMPDASDQLVSWAGPRHAWVWTPGIGIELRTVDLATGRFTPVSASRLPLPFADWNISAWRAAADATGKYLLARTDGRLQAFEVDFASGAVRALGAGLQLVGDALEFGDLTHDPRTGRFHLADLVLELDPVAGVRVSGVSPLGASPQVLVPGTALSRFTTTLYGIDPAARVLRELTQDPNAGTLTPLALSPRPVAGRPEAIALAPTGAGIDAGEHPALGSFVAVASSNGSGNGTLSLFPISDPVPAASLAQTIAIGARPTAAAVEWRTGRTIYVAHAGEEGIDAVTTATFPMSRLPGAPYPVAYGFVPSRFVEGRFVYGPPPPLALPATDLLMSPRGDVFVAIPTGAQVHTATSTFTVGAISTQLVGEDLALLGRPTGAAGCAVGALPDGSTLNPTAAGTVGLASIGGGRLVYAVNRDADNVVGYRATGGQCLGEAWMPLVAGGPFPTGPRPVAMTADPSGRFVYVANSGGNGSLSAYQVHPATGTLRPVSGSPFALGRVPARLWTDVLGHFLYVSDAGGSVTVHGIDRATGAPGAGRAAAAGQPMTIGVTFLGSVR